MRERLRDCRKRVNRLPLGAAALAGTSYPIKREYVADLLGFDGVCENSLDAVSDRDFAIEFTACAALIMTHLSRFSEELILWMNPRFGFIDIADRFCTGSSIMPQKKNPDVPELVRGKTGRVNGHLVALLTLMKGQPLAYNKDNQEDKEPLFDTVETLAQTLRIYADMIAGIKVKPEAMRSAALQGYATATDLADYLVKKGLPFRDAHEAVAQGRALCRTAQLRSGRHRHRRAAAILAAHRRRCLSGVVAGRIARQPQPYRRNGAGSGRRRDRPGARQPGKIIQVQQKRVACRFWSRSA